MGQLKNSRLHSGPEVDLGVYSLTRRKQLSSDGPQQSLDTSTFSHDNLNPTKGCYEVSLSSVTKKAGARGRSPPGGRGPLSIVSTLANLCLAI